ncbi:MAG: Stp1/IreP family PP2C-type Ser/Thr phosphatase [Chromatiales bacterium]
MDLTGTLEVVNLSDPGQKRPRNEDSTASDPRLGFAMIADGMGGYKAGEIASAIAVSVVMDLVRHGLAAREPHQIDKASGRTMGALMLRQAIQKANLHIFETANSEPQCHGMGTTVLCTLFYDDRICVAHVGDSRLYRFRRGSFEQVTNDHSLVQELVDRGFLSKEEAIANTPKNLVTRALGIEDAVDVDITEERVLPGDIYLLCTDGLNDMMSDEEIRLTLSKYSANLLEAGREMVRVANAKGGKDNISVILARVLSGFPARSAWHNLMGWLKKVDRRDRFLWRN